MYVQYPTHHSRTTLMIVDDHPELRNGICEWLQAYFPGLRCLQAESAEIALSIINDQRPGIILLDLWLPGMNGVEATKRIKERHPDSTIIIISIHDDAEHREAAKSAGALGYVPKLRMHLELIPLLEPLLKN